MTRALIMLVLVAACSEKLPSRPDETKFRAMSFDDKCRATASRAIICTNELIVAQLRGISGLDGAEEMADEVGKQLANDPSRSPKQDRKENIQMHKTQCIADNKYADAVFECWAIEDCKKFAACVESKPHEEHTPRAPAPD